MRLNTAVTIDHFLIHNRFSGIVACQIKKINILNRFCSPSPPQPKKKKKVGTFTLQNNTSLNSFDASS